MELFFTLFLKLLPLYAVILLGFIGGRYFQINKEPIAAVLIYIIATVVIFEGAATVQLNAAVLLLPFLFFALCCLFCLFFFYVGKKLWKDPTKNILAFTAGTGNTGYFGIPLAIAVFDESILGLVVLSIMGFILYENTLGFFITAKGQHTPKEALTKVLKLPTIYAFIIGIIVNIVGLPIAGPSFDILQSFRGAYTILGMMIIGLALGSIKTFEFDVKFTCLTLLIKFIMWPMVTAFLIFIDRSFIGLFNETIYSVMLIMSIVPLAANTVAFATQLRAHPEKAAIAVIISTVVALIYIPLFVSLFIR